MVGEEIKEESVKQTSVLEVIAGVLAGGNKSIDNLQIFQQKEGLLQ